MAKEIKPGKNDESFRLAKFWLDHIEQVDQLQRNWLRKGDTIIKRFRDDRNRADENTLRRLNVLWANIKILMPALYGKAPIPYVERKFLQHDPIARLSSKILENTLKNELDLNGLHTSIRRAVLDYLLPGRGCVWVRYEPDVGEVGDSIPIEPANSLEDDLEGIEGDTDKDPRVRALENTGEQLLTEQAPVDYIHWKDLYLFPATARTWDEVEAVGKRVNISKAQAIERFGKEVGSQLRYNNTSSDQARRVPFSDTAVFQSATQQSIEVFEIWNKVDRKIYWVSVGYSYLCDVKDDFLKLVNFFPIPPPISATLTNESLVPVPDYIEYQDQAIQIDELTQRLSMLTKACKVAGCYDAANGSLKRLFQEGFENDLIPVDAWAMFAEKGGVQGGIALLPIEEIQAVIETLTKVRQQLMMDLDLVTGISDIIRGTTDSRETLGGIRLKNNNAGTRLSDRVAEVTQFVRNTLAIVGEVCSKFYSDKKLIETSGILYDQEMQPEAVLEEFAPPAQPQGQQPPQPGQNTAPNNQSQPPMGGPANPFKGGLNSLGGPQPPQNGNVLPFPQLNDKIPPAINSPMGTPPAQPFFDEPEIDPLEIITERLEKAIALLRDDVPRCYRIDIETDSTVFGDAAQERQDVAMFMGEISKYLAGAAQLGAELPEAVPALCQMLLWGVRKFRIGRDLESSFDDFVHKVNKRVKEQLKNPKPSPEEQKAQADLEATKLETASKQKEMQMQHEHLQQSNQMDMQKQQADHQLAQDQAKMDMEMKQQEHQMKLKEMQMKHQLEMAKMQMEMKKMQAELQMQSQQHSMQMEQDQTQHQQAMQQNEQQHQQTVEQTEMQGEQAREQHQQTMQQTELKGEQANQQHKQKMQQTQMQGKQAEAKHKQTMQQAAVKKKAEAK